MSKSIALMGESGSGKTTSMRTLNPDETYYIDADGKGLSWKGWRSQYNKERKNYFRTDRPDKVLEAMVGVDQKRPEIKYLVIDTINGLMISDEMRRAKEKGFDKWQDLAASVYAIVDLSNRLRDDLTVFCLAHSETVVEESGYQYTRIKTSGKKLSKIVLESKFTSVFLAKAENGIYKLQTRAVNSTAKTPMGAFESEEIDNDASLIVKALEDF